MGSARAADEWFVLSEQTLNATDPSATIKSAGGRWEKDVKQLKLSVEGADVEITNPRPQLGQSPGRHGQGRRRREVGGTNVREGCSGTQGPPHRVQVQYKILGGARRPS
jgi:hypothetical protein